MAHRDAMDRTSNAPDVPLRVHSVQPNPELHPDLAQVQSATLKEGPRVRKEASHTVIVNRHTGEIHHDAITIKTYRKKSGTWSIDLQRSITLDSENGDDAIQRLIDFLVAVRSGALPKKSGSFLVVTAPSAGEDSASIQKVLNQLSSTGKADLLADVLSKTSSDPKLLHALLDRAAKDPELFAEASAALNLARYQQAVKDLEQLIGNSSREQDFQRLLSHHPWMFGSEYSEVLDRRKWTRDEQQDFVVRRTTDGFIELIEIKTPLNGTPLFRFDDSHKCHYAGVDLSKVVGQVANYIEKLDQCRNDILANDKEDTCKIRSKIIIGRDGDENQRKALRRFNAHLNRVEVITFDQLLKIANGAIAYLDSALRPSAVAATTRSYANANEAAVAVPVED